MITVLEAHGPVTVQDLGWRGYYKHGVSRSGAMDRLALTLGNILLGNEEGAAGIEVPLPPIRLRFECDLGFAVAGADCDARLDGEPVPPYWGRRARAGQELRLGPPRTGHFAYIAVEGGIDVPLVLGSRSTHLRGGFGGVCGRPLQPGDRLRAGRSNGIPLPPGGLGALPPPPLEGPADAVAIRVLPASEYELLTAESQRHVWGARWTVTRQSNRAGYRLEGPAVRMASPTELRSHGLVPGTIQLPAGGSPIIQLADAATMGGYPKIGVVIEADLWRVAQVRPGQKLTFVEVTYAEAVSALRDLEAHVRQCRALLACARSALEKQS